MIDHPIAQTIFEKALAAGADFAELFIEEREDFSFDYDPHPAPSLRKALGCGLYLIKDLKSVYLFTNDLREEGLVSLLQKGLWLLSPAAQGEGQLEGRGHGNRERLYIPELASCGRKIVKEHELLREVHGEALALEGVSQMSLLLHERRQRITVLNSEGLEAGEERQTCRLRFTPVVFEKGESTSRFFEYCISGDLERLLGEPYLPYMQQNLKSMKESLFAQKAKTGLYPVVFAGGSASGTFFHECCGHQLEAGPGLKEALFYGKIGEKIASDKVTLVDDGSLPGRYGSSRFDDEGMERQRNILIEKGVLKAYLTDRMGARRYELARSASGRREDYTHAPAPRMSNTFLLAGEDDEEKMIADIPEGLYVTGTGGGSGGREFTLAASEAYWIQNGQIGPRVKGASLVGRGDEMLLQIDRVGKDFVFDQGGGSYCGASSGFIPTTTSGPAIRIKEMLVS